MLYLLAYIILISYYTLSFIIAGRLHIYSRRAVLSAVVARIACKEKSTSSNRKGVGLSLIAIA
jgi:hypothetical protein